MLPESKALDVAVAVHQIGIRGGVGAATGFYASRPGELQDVDKHTSLNRETQSSGWFLLEHNHRMGTKMKGLLKGLRYISQIFDTNEKEREMEIGFPTDVKHVAHIGWDGPSVSNPSWMNEYRSVPEFNSAPLTPTGTVMDPVPGPKSASQDLQRLMESENSVDGSSAAPRQARRHRSSGGVPGDTDSPEVVKPSRRRPSIGESSELMGQDQLPKPLKPARRRATHGSGALDSPTIDSPGVPRQSRRRQSKGSCGSVGGSSSKPSRSRASMTTAEEDEPAKAPEENEPATQE